jgi:hypothetical protein
MGGSYFLSTRAFESWYQPVDPHKHQPVSKTLCDHPFDIICYPLSRVNPNPSLSLKFTACGDFLRTFARPLGKYFLRDDIK